MEGGYFREERIFILGWGHKAGTSQLVDDLRGDGETPCTMPGI